MDAVLRGLSIYLFLLVIFRISGKRSLAQITTFDFVLLLVVGEATQQALLGHDYSLTGAMLVIVTLIGVDIGLSLLARRYPRLDKVLDDVPLILVENGRPLEQRMQQVRVSLSEVMAAARERQGLERLDQIKYAVLERSGGISIIPRRDGDS